MTVDKSPSRLPREWKESSINGKIGLRQRYYGPTPKIECIDLENSYLIQNNIKCLRKRIYLLNGDLAQSNYPLEEHYSVNSSMVVPKIDVVKHKIRVEQGVDGVITALIVRYQNYETWAMSSPDELVVPYINTRIVKLVVYDSEISEEDKLITR